MLDIINMSIVCINVVISLRTFWNLNIINFISKFEVLICVVMFRFL